MPQSLWLGVECLGFCFNAGQSVGSADLATLWSSTQLAIR